MPPKMSKDVPKVSPSSKTRNDPCKNANSGCKLFSVTLIKATQDKRSLNVSILPVCSWLNHCKAADITQ